MRTPFRLLAFVCARAVALASLLAAPFAAAACGRSEAPAPVASTAQGAAPPPSLGAASDGGTSASASAATSGVAPVESSAPPAASAASAAPASSAVGSSDAAPPDMLAVPGGTFTMGADEGGEQDEHPAHEVTIAPFLLDKTEVTNAQWLECVAAKSCRPKSDDVRRKHPDFDGPQQPVSGVAWDDARGYCAWRGKRLPREAEFERAVRGDDGRRFPWGNDAPTHDRTVFSSGHTEDVGTHPAGRGPYGHDDLAGNVWEWMEDEYDPYAYRRPTASEGKPAACPDIMAALGELRRNHLQGFTGTNPIPDECEHSIRGGAYNFDPHGLRSTNRVHHPGRYRIPMLGVRCAKDATR